jgi:hypothetical protein
MKLCRAACRPLMSRRQSLDCLNQDVIIDYWNGMIDFDDVKPRLQQVQP